MTGILYYVLRPLPNYSASCRNHSFLTPWVQPVVKEVMRTYRRRVARREVQKNQLTLMQLCAMVREYTTFYHIEIRPQKSSRKQNEGEPSSSDKTAGMYSKSHKSM